MILASVWSNVGLAVFALLVLVGVGIVVWRKAQLGPAKAEELPYQRKAVLTAAEQSFYHVLSGCIEGKAILLSQIALSEAVEVKRLSDPKAKQGFWNKINRKHLDFVLCDPANFTPLLAIELDDSSHSRKRAQQRGRQKDEILAAAGIPILRVTAARTYDTRQLALDIDANLTGEDHKTDHEEHNCVTPPPSPATTHEQKTCDDMKCPKCGSQMVKRKSRQGQHMGKEFWGCTAYPKCKTVVPID